MNFTGDEHNDEREAGLERSRCNEIDSPDFPYS